MQKIVESFNVKESVFNNFEISSSVKPNFLYKSLLNCKIPNLQHLIIKLFLLDDDFIFN